MANAGPISPKLNQGQVQNVNGVSTDEAPFDG